jgi:hypothetical protein
MSDFSSLRAGVVTLALTLPIVVVAAVPDFPLVCRGAAGMASTFPTSGGNANLIVDFAPANGPVSAGLEPGQCSWVDRALRPGEPFRVVEESLNAGSANSIADALNRGELWTFWVFNVGRFFHATTDFRGEADSKPHPIDSPN